MPNKTAGFITVALSLALFTALLSCAIDKAPVQIENSLSQSEIAYFTAWIKCSLWALLTRAQKPANQAL